MKKLIAPLLIALLAGCATEPPPAPTPVARPRPVPTRPPVTAPVGAGLQIDRSYSAKGQSSRVKFIIVHYTVSDTPRSLKTLTQDTVSSHYLLTDDPDPVLYGLVDEARQANHAGVSSWKNYTLLNGSSIGIEIVNPGFIEGPNGRVYQPFPQAQIDKLIVLMKDIAARHQIPPENVLGHSDIAPLRKQDPGPMFPWAQLAQHGLVLWPDAARVQAGRLLYEQQLPDARWFQQKLATHGYGVPRTGEFDEQTRLVLSAFQSKYRPQDIGGFPDAETAALLEAMNPTPAPAVLVAPSLARPALPVPAAPVRVMPAAPAIAPTPAPVPAAPARVIPAPLPAMPAPAVPAPTSPAMPVPAVPVPTVPAPAIPAPTIPAPTIPAPTIPAPTIPAPAVPAPGVPAPVLPAPVVPAPVQPAPVVPAPVQPAPVIAAPPAAPAPVAPATEAPAPATVTPAPARP